MKKEYKTVESDSAIDELERDVQTGLWRVVRTHYKRKRLGCGHVAWKQPL